MQSIITSPVGGPLIIKVRQLFNPPPELKELLMMGRGRAWGRLDVRARARVCVCVSVGGGVAGAWRFNTEIGLDIHRMLGTQAIRVERVEYP